MRTQIIRSVVLSAALLATGCDGLLEVSNPGPILDRDLDVPAAMPALVVGMSADLSNAVATSSIWGSVWSDDMSHSGTLGAPTVFAQGVIASFDIGPWWNNAQRARWVAEDGIERLQRVLGTGFETFASTPRAYVHAGFANRILGENACEAVFDGGPARDHMEHFQRAEQHFGEALRIAQAQNNTTALTAARAGRAQVRVALGDWSGAVTDASAVPIDFVHYAVFSLNSGREQSGWNAATITRGEYSVFGTQWAEVSDDPRTPWTALVLASGAPRMAANGRVPWYRQEKYVDDGTDIPLAKGTEMLLIRAEAALVGGDVPGAMTLINQVRAYHDLSALSATTEVEAWPILQSERGKTLWLEGRRFWDLRRWNAATGPAKNTFLDGRDSCVPISDDERLVNPNLG